jgi:hypothetical protein
METLSSLQAQIMTLPDGARANLASFILQSLPAVYIDEDEDDDGLAEALRREAEMEADPSMCITFEELKRSVGR